MERWEGEFHTNGLDFVNLFLAFGCYAKREADHAGVGLCKVNLLFTGFPIILRVSRIFRANSENLRTTGIPP